MRPILLVFKLLFAFSLFAQTKDSLVNNVKSNGKETPTPSDKSVTAETSPSIPIDLIPYDCGDELKYIVLDSSSKYVVIAVADNERKIKSDSLFQQQSTYSDETVSAFLQRTLNTPTKNSSDSCYSVNRKLLLRRIRDKADEIFQSKTSQNDKATIESLEKELQKEFIAGTFHSPSKEIPLYGKVSPNDNDSIERKNSSPSNDNNSQKGNDTLSSRNKQRRALRKQLRKNADSTLKHSTSDAYRRRNKSTNYVLIADSIIIRTDYNRIKKIQISGWLKYKQINKDTSMRVNITNDAYSLSLIGLNNGDYVVKLPQLSDSSLWLNYADVVQYEPFVNEASNIIANQSLLVVPGGRALVRKRNLNDYLSFRTFLDPLGFLGNNPNGFAQLEGHAIVPMGLTNKGRWNWFPQLTGNFNYIYSNSINNEPRIVPVYNLRNTARPDDANPLSLTSADTSRFASNLDYVRYSYYQFKAHLSAVALELKNWNAWLHLELGVNALGSKVDTVASKTHVVHKFIPETRVRLEIRPDYIIGASISAGFAYLANTHQGNNSPQNIKDVSFLYRSPFAIPHEVSVYAITGNGNGGLFFRYTGWIAFHEKLAAGVSVANLSSNVGIQKTSYFPQILVGYATNLSAIVNRVPKQTTY